MLNKLENFLLNKFGGKLIARAAVNIAGVLVGIAASKGITIDQNEAIAATTIGANWLFEWFKARRMANPASPAVQTDKSKIAEASAAATP